MLRTLASLVLTFMLLGTAAAEPVARALLVGVSNYPKEAVGDFQLAGPKNDVALMIETLPLIGIRPENTVVLADSLDQTASPRKADGLPTRKAILDGLDRLAAASAPGDFALVYLSGHGSRQPDLDPGKREVPQADGFDEVFLPIDIGVWESDKEKVENAILDFELGQAVRKLRARGVHVWVIVDACHSGTMTRSASEGVVKQVPMEALKIPPAAIEKAKALARQRAEAARAATGGQATRSLGAGQKTRSLWAGTDPATDTGSYVAFFAAHPDERARQENLPAEADDRQPRSVLTWHLVRALRSGQAATYRDLGYVILQGYEQLSGVSPVPMFEGDLSRPVIGAGGGGERRYLAQLGETGMEVFAGVADGLGVGAVLSLAAPDEPDKTFAYARIERAHLSRSPLTLIARDGIDGKEDDFRKGMPLTARVVEKTLDAPFAVAVLPGERISAADRAGAEALDAVLGSAATPYARASGERPADLNLAIAEGRLWFVPPGESLRKAGRDRTASVPLPATADAARRAVEKHLARYYKVRNLTRIAAAMGPAALKDKLRIEAFLMRAATGPEPGARAPDDFRCAPAERRLPAGATPIDAALAGDLALRHCDRVYFRLTNLGDKPIDVTPLYVDGDAMTSYRADEYGLRLEPEAVPTILSLGVVTFSMRRGEPEATGDERMLFIAVEAPDRQALPADYRQIADDAPLSRAAAGGPAALRAFLNASTRGGPKTRSAVVAPAPGGDVAAGVIDYRWRVVPPEGAR